MSEAAKSVKHYVSDCLEERHPYDVQKGFAGQRERDSGKVFDGFSSEGVDQLLHSLVDTSLTPEERAVAARYLYSRSASQEEKIQCFHILRSLCVVTQGCYSVVFCGGLEAIVECLADIELSEDKKNTKTAACQALYQICLNSTGLRWLLQAEDCEEFIPDTVADVPSTPPDPARVLATTGNLLAVCGFDSKLTLYLMSSLSLMVQIAPGIHAFLSSESLYMKVFRASLEHVSEERVLREEKEYSKHLFTAVWNVAMDQKGVECLEKSDVVPQLFVIFSLFDTLLDAVDFDIQRQVMGAVSATFKLTSTKHDSLSTLHNDQSRIVCILDYLRRVNGVEEKQKKEFGKPKNNIIAILKNTVQCVRLASEVKGVRDVTHEYIKNMTEESSSEGFYFRRQLYFGTRWEAEYDASV